MAITLKIDLAKTPLQNVNDAVSALLKPGVTMPEGTLTYQKSTTVIPVDADGRDTLLNAEVVQAATGFTLGQQGTFHYKLVDVTDAAVLEVSFDTPLDATLIKSVVASTLKVHADEFAGWPAFDAGANTEDVAEFDLTANAASLLYKGTRSVKVTYIGADPDFMDNFTSSQLDGFLQATE